MKNKQFINTLRDTLNKLEEKNSGLLADINNIKSDAGRDPEKSDIHGMWNAYMVQKEFKEFIEGLLQKQTDFSKAI